MSSCYRSNTQCIKFKYFGVAFDRSPTNKPALESKNGIRKVNKIIRLEKFEIYNIAVME